MISAPPLQNKHVLIARGAKQAKSFSELVKKLGGIPVEIPLIAFRPVPESAELDAVLKELHTYDWIVFTSNVTVETFLARYQAGGDFPRIAVIGEKTRETLEQQNFHVRFTPQEYVAEGFVKEFLPHVSKGMRVLIPKGNLARDYIASALKKQGVIVDEIIIYETYMPENSRSMLAQMLAEDKLEILTFTSPSTIDHFMNIVKDYQLESKLEDCTIACIGPISQKKAEEYGLPVHACPSTYTVEEMMKSVVHYLNHVKE
ncbi:uroporphyrinogen-III synthase [Mesobacillus maritimus]|uniref:uroporphyrinogen-III synthase n=1 Tax=Mesobacillus maritimus TaxID=1643336 RepID=UPI00203E687F|nr:uroporphyrinogen-III synthase [Mesobacillus maritimus]MCM3587644.1 uroporphyrinogen-III synthase [Mesobacillus maritimus]MCM3669889.1 uroporphyrinogen-III synthase [Mesobacillus maritimus]